MSQSGVPVVSQAASAVSSVAKFAGNAAAGAGDAVSKVVPQPVKAAVGAVYSAPIAIYNGVTGAAQGNNVAQTYAKSVTKAAASYGNAAYTLSNGQSSKIPVYGEYSKDAAIVTNDFTIANAKNFGISAGKTGAVVLSGVYAGPAFAKFAGVSEGVGSVAATKISSDLLKGNFEGALKSATGFSGLDTPFGNISTDTFFNGGSGPQFNPGGFVDAPKNASSFSNYSTYNSTSKFTPILVFAVVGLGTYFLIRKGK